MKIIVNRTQQLILRVRPDEYEKLKKRLQKSTCRSMSEYSRNVLLQKPITFTYRNRSMDDVLEELIQIRDELNHIGNNFNQAVHKLNSVMGMPNAELWQATLIILRDQLEPSIRVIKEKMDDYSEIWSKSLPPQKS